MGSADEVGERRRAGTRRRTAARRAGRRRRRRPGRRGRRAAPSATAPRRRAGGRRRAPRRSRRRAAAARRSPCPSPPSVRAPTPTASTGRGPSRTEKVAIAVAPVALDVGDVLEHRDREGERHGDRDQRPHARARPAVPATCSQTPRLTTSERTKVIEPRGHAGIALEPQRRARVGPADRQRQRRPRRARPTPCVTAMSSGRDAPRRRRSAAPPSSDRSPAAIGSHGLLSRSISTSSIWLIPTMKTFTHSAGDAASRSRSTASRGAVAADAAIA